MRRAPMFVSAVAAMAAVALMATPATGAPASTPLKGAQQAFGKPLGDWIGAWWQHYLELPVSENPLASNGSRCGSVGKVLMPVYGPGFDAECTGRR